MRTDPQYRVALDGKLREAILEAVNGGRVSLEEVTFLLVRMLPELAPQNQVFGHVVAAYELARQRGQEGFPMDDATLAGVRMLEGLLSGMFKAEGRS